MKTLLLIDANSFIHRAFHALPPLTSSDGRPVGAIYGLASTLLKIIREEIPNYIAAAFDRPETTFRKELFEEYKIHRPKAPNELIEQIIKAHELFKNFDIPIFEKAGFEGDDIIGTLVKKFKNENDLKTIILTGDLDSLQLVQDDKVTAKIPKKGISETVIYNEKAVFERFGLKPKELADYKGLVGDKSDNIPGVPGVGPKTASSLILKHSSLEKMFKNLKPVDPLSTKLINFKDQALLSKKLAIINCEIPLNVALENLAYPGIKPEKLIKFFTNLGFQSLIQRIFNQNSLFAETAHQPSFKLEKRIDVVFIQSADFTAENIRKINNPKETKVAYDWKTIFKEINTKIEIENHIFDLKIAGWLIDPDQKDFSFESLSRRFLYRNPGNPLTKENIIDLFEFVDSKIKEYELTNVFENIEMPLIKILAGMEKTGIGINIKALKELKEEIDLELKKLTELIYNEAQEEFNINSPQQIAHIIFEKLKIKNYRNKKTPGGKKSTAEAILNELKNVHPIIKHILEYRESFKIQSTYVKPLLRLERESIIHTTFLQTGTATGRLSSEKPNLQNIPQESKWALPLRKIFKAKLGFSFLSFDYSQLELRLLAHLSKDEKLRKAFIEKKDIHQLTASQIFNVPLDKVGPPMRRIAKTLNFGIIYGMGARAFSKTSGLNLADAEKFIKEYFNDFPEVKIWQEKIKNEMKALGYVKNLNGRRRWFLNIPSQLHIINEMERAAVNMPIQSLGADILKLSMIKTSKALENDGLTEKAKLLLTIHDELLFEVSDDILKKVAVLLKGIIEESFALSIPLEVETKTGKNWGNMEKFKF